MIGRSHGIHAEPITAGLTFARWYAEVARAGAPIVRARARRSRSARSPARSASTATSIPPIEVEALAALGLRPGDRGHADRRARSPRRGVVRAGAARHRDRADRARRAPLAAHRGRRGRGGVRQGAEGLVGDAAQEEPDPVGEPDRAGAAAARLRRRRLEDVALWHERDISHSSVERVAMPDATILARLHAARATALVDGLVVHPEAMRANLERTGGLVFSESIMLRLVATGLPRQKAYEMVQRNALAAHEGRGRFRDLLASDADITARLRPRRARRLRSICVTTCATRTHPGPCAPRRPGDIMNRAQTTSCAPAGQHARRHALRGPRRALRGQGPRQLLARWPAHHRGLGSLERVRRGARHDPVQGPGAEPAGAVLVRGDQAAGRRTTCSARPTPT